MAPAWAIDPNAVDEYTQSCWTAHLDNPSSAITLGLLLPVLQFAGQPSAGAMQPSFHSRHRYIERLRDLVKRALFVELDLHDRSQRGLQSGQGMCYATASLALKAKFLRVWARTLLKEGVCQYLRSESALLEESRGLYLGMGTYLRSLA
jgi:hypothetical protein